MLAVDTYGTLAEADRAMTDRSRYLGGGTLLMRSINHGNRGFDRVVRTTDPTLGRIQSEGGLVTVGAGATMAAILASQELAFLAPAASRDMTTTEARLGFLSSSSLVRYRSNLYPPRFAP